MLIKIGNKIFDSLKEPVAILFDQGELQHIRVMPPSDDGFCGFPETWAPEKGRAWLKENIQSLRAHRLANNQVKRDMDKNGVIPEQRVLERLAERENVNPVQLREQQPAPPPPPSPAHQKTESNETKEVLHVRPQDLPHHGKPLPKEVVEAKNATQPKPIPKSEPVPKLEATKVSDEDILKMLGAFRQPTKVSEADSEEPQVEATNVSDDNVLRMAGIEPQTEAQADVNASFKIVESDGDKE